MVKRGRGKMLDKAIKLWRRIKQHVQLLNWYLFCKETWLDDIPPEAYNKR